MRKLIIIGLIIIVFMIVASGYFLLKIIPKTAPIIAIIILIFSIFVFHESGHLLLAKLLGYHPSALAISFLVIPSGAFNDYTENSKKHGKIIKAGGPLGSFIAVVFFGVVLNRFSSLQPIIQFATIGGFIMALAGSTSDFTEIFSWPRDRSDSDTLNYNINLLQQGHAWLLVFSEKRWVKLKEKMEQQLGRKINFREIILN